MLVSCINRVNSFWQTVMGCGPYQNTCMKVNLCASASEFAKQIQPGERSSHIIFWSLEHFEKVYVKDQSENGVFVRKFGTIISPLPKKKLRRFKK